MINAVEISPAGCTTRARATTQEDADESLTRSDIPMLIL